MKEIRGRTALVTGGAGFIGCHLVDHLLKNQWHVKVIDNLSTGKLTNLEQYTKNPSLEIIIGDLKKPHDCRMVVQDVEVVFHFAANPEVKLSTTYPKIHFEQNIMATFNLLEAIRRKSNVKYLIFASSSSVYGEPERIPTKETDPLKPLSVYGASKVACEALLQSYSNLYGIKSVALRYANVVGHKLNHGVIYDFIQKLRRNSKELEILGNGTQIRSYLFVHDAVKAALIAYMHAYTMMSNYFEVYNVGNEDWLTIKEVADIVIETMGLRDVKYVFRPMLYGVGWPGDIKKIIMDISKIKSLGYKPSFTSREAVKLTVKSLCKAVN